MFFDAARITAVLEMILADSEKGRRVALEKLLPEQRDDFAQIFMVMAGLPVTTRLLAPPLHDFVPQGEADGEEGARAAGAGREALTRRAAQLHESNPMLGHRACSVRGTTPQKHQKK